MHTKEFLHWKIKNKYTVEMDLLSTSNINFYLSS